MKRTWRMKAKTRAIELSKDLQSKPIKTCKINGKDAVFLKYSRVEELVRYVVKTEMMFKGDILEIEFEE